jgi:hypothetical protein
MKRLVYFFGLSFFIYFISCDISDRRLCIKNNSDKAIFYALNMECPDTILPDFDLLKSYSSEEIKRNKKNIDFFEYGISVGSQKASTEYGSWEMDINNSCNKRIVIFILDSSVVLNRPWQKIRQENLILKRYEFTTSDLKKLNWTVIFE